ncbi:hypothetical protein CHR62_09165 [Pusillimonas sp. NJUB218]|nr:hypothetical protein CHR62_09165 [Pusillimonas sp. NJUB218]
MLALIESAPVYTRYSLIRRACLSAPPGIACEFGVFKGDSLRVIRNFRKPPVFGFDTWSGLPEAWDMGQAEHPTGHFACDVPRDFAIGVQLVQGLFSETLPLWLAEHGEPVQFVHIDCDLYSSARDVLTLLNEHIQPGTILLFDELCSFDGSYQNWLEGEWKALNEWLATGRQVKPIGRTDRHQVAFVVEV